MKHSAAIGLIVLVALNLGLIHADEGKLPTIGQIWFTNPSLVKPFDDAFRDGLRSLGYIDGKNVTILARFEQGNTAQAPVLAKELVGLHVDVMVVNGKALRQAMQATTTIPIVSVFGDPIAQGLVTSLAHPGGNVTGVSAQAWDTDSKRLELAKEALPGVTRVSLLFDASLPDDVSGANDFRSLARKQGVTVRMLGVRSLKEIRAVLSNIDKSRQRALIVFDSPLTFFHRAAIMNLAAHRIAVISEDRGWADAGALIAYAPDAVEMWRKLASYIDMILKGAKAGDLPIEQANKFHLVVNLRTAKDLGIDIPQAILLRADTVIR
jgi:putative ABC transport system substrate-binding protein